MSCSMPYPEDICDPSVRFEESTVKARKDHRCYECNREIPKGTKHDIVKVLFDGEGWETLRRCPLCSYVAEVCGMKSGECPLWGGLIEATQEAGVDFYGIAEKWEHSPDA